MRFIYQHNMSVTKVGHSSCNHLLALLMVAILSLCCGHEQRLPQCQENVAWEGFAKKQIQQHLLCMSI